LIDSEIDRLNKNYKEIENREAVFKSSNHLVFNKLLKPIKIISDDIVRICNY